jgi:hypothetical protein
MSVAREAPRSTETQGDAMTDNSNALKYCFHGQHSKPRADFKKLPGVKTTREVCAACYAKIMADRKQKKSAEPAR